MIVSYCVEMIKARCTNPSGKICTICLPKINEALWMISPGLTLCSEMEISRSYATLTSPEIQAAQGIYVVSLDRPWGARDLPEYGTSRRCCPRRVAGTESMWSGKPIPATGCAALAVQPRKFHLLWPISRGAKWNPDHPMQSEIHRTSTRSMQYTPRRHRVAGRERRSHRWRSVAHCYWGSEVVVSRPWRRI